jgi:hypothetical protein
MFGCVRKSFGIWEISDGKFAEALPTVSTEILPVDVSQRLTSCFLKALGQAMWLRPAMGSTGHPHYKPALPHISQVYPNRPAQAKESIRCAIANHI